MTLSAARHMTNSHVALNLRTCVIRSEMDDGATMTRSETLASDETTFSRGKVSHHKNAVYARRDHKKLPPGAVSPLNPISSHDNSHNH